MSRVSLLPQELHQNDVFVVELPQQLSVTERQLLTLFYQPIVGGKALSLYFTLWAEGEFQANQPTMHYFLMQTLDMGLQEILKARLALEAIGLMRTWRTTEGEERHFIYALERPLEAAYFFADPLLSMMLYSKIGERNYRNLRSRFIERQPTRTNFTEVTRTFTDVFTPINSAVPTELTATMPAPASKTYPFMQQNFDFALLQAGLQEHLVPAASLTAEVREIIAKLAFLYQLTPLDMQKVVILALDDDLVISEKQLRRAAVDYYKLTVSQTMPQLTPVFDKQPTASQGQSKQEKHLHYLATASPLENLRRLHKGATPSDSAVQLVESLYMRYGLTTGVVNVLVEYVMLITDMKLPKKFVESIADHWRRKDIRTVEQAMQLAKSEQHKYNKLKNNIKEPIIKKVEPVTTDNEFDNYTPYEFLKRLNNGQEPFDFIVTIAEGLVTKHTMPVGVVNVLMNYAMQQTDGKVTRNFVETIASNWQQRGITTVEEALAATTEQTAAYRPRVTRQHITSTATKYDAMTPYAFMKACLNNQEPFPSMVALAENLVLTYDMPVGVVNVLVEYILQKEAGKFPKRLVETIANEWRQQQVKTVNQAQKMLAQHDAPKKFTPRITLCEEQAVGYEKYAQPPYVFLCELHQGKEPLAKDSKLVEDLVLQHKLPIIIANILVEYVFKRKEGLLPRAYVEAIANRWQVNGVVTPAQAMAQTEPKSSYTPQITTAPASDNAYDSVTPYEFLKLLNNGQEPFANDVKMAEELVTIYGLSIGVTNVLVEYVYTLQQGKLPKNYCNTIASTWRAQGITTVEAALAHVVEQQKNYEARQQGGRRITGKVEHVPDWLKPTKQITEHVTPPNFDEERAEILASLGRTE